VADKVAEAELKRLREAIEATVHPGFGQDWSMKLLRARLKIVLTREGRHGGQVEKLHVRNVELQSQLDILLRERKGQESEKAFAELEASNNVLKSELMEAQGMVDVLRGSLDFDEKHAKELGRLEGLLHDSGERERELHKECDKAAEEAYRKSEEMDRLSRKVAQRDLEHYEGGIRG